MQAAYEAASDEYEEKLLRQAEAFKKDRELLRKDIEGYRKLLQKYEDYIAELKKDNDVLKSSLLQRLQAEYDELKTLEVNTDES